MFPLISHHLVVNSKKEAFIYRRLPGTFFWFLSLALLLGGGVKLLTSSPPLWLAVVLIVGVVLLGVGMLVVCAFTLAFFMDGEAGFFKVRMKHHSKLDKEAVADLLPRLTVKAYDRLPQDFFDVTSSYAAIVPCLITEASQANDDHLRIFLKKEAQRKREEARLRAAKQEVALRQRWQR